MSGNNMKKEETIEESKVFIRMRNLIFLLLGLLIAQFWLGMTINLEVNIPVKTLGAIQSIIYFASHYAFIFAHVAVGFTILLLSLVFIILSISSHALSLQICAVVILAGVIGAITNGVLFLMSGQFFGWSVGMAMSAVSVLIVAAISLYFLGKIMGKAERMIVKE
ncbi:MAG: hypothetical protein QW597_04355 [Thermoplasmataceae archaeon]